MNQDSENNSIVSGGGWVETEVTEKYVAHGFKHYLFWSILSTITFSTLLFIHFISEHNFFSFSLTSFLALGSFIVELYYIKKLTETYGKKTITFTKTSIEQIPNPDYDPNNLY